MGGSTWNCVQRTVPGDTVEPAGAGQFNAQSRDLVSRVQFSTTTVSVVAEGRVDAECCSQGLAIGIANDIAGNALHKPDGLCGGHTLYRDFAIRIAVHEHGRAATRGQMNGLQQIATNIPALEHGPADEGGTRCRRPDVKADPCRCARGGQTIRLHQVAVAFLVTVDVLQVDRGAAQEHRIRTCHFDVAVPRIGDRQVGLNRRNPDVPRD